MKIFKKILIANRGEIAVRIIRTCLKLNIKTGIVFSWKDGDSLAVRMADESYRLSGNTLQETYLNMEQIVAIAKKHHFDAIHPGYGFLSENAPFAQACQVASIFFIGPQAEVIELMGDKVKSKKLAEKAGVPILHPILGNIESLEKYSAKLEYPVLIKAVSGGGGKGMRIVKNKDNLHDALITTSREAKSYFNDDRIFIEKYIEEPRHIEVQVLADLHGNSTALFDRECSLQRRHQKVIEEAPSPSLTTEKRNELINYALRLVKESHYTNAGTIEFMADEEMNFYFLEMNTRIQVEHPATEMITGIDLVEEQIRVAEGHKLSLQQSDLKINGHAIEARVYAEDPENNFYPSPGTIHYYEEPKIDNIRIDSSTDGIAAISDDFDPMVSKVISWAANRNEAIRRLSENLNNYFIHGVKTNLSFLNQLLSLPDFRKNKLSTHFIDQKSGQIVEEIRKRKSKVLPELLIAFSRFFLKHHSEKKNIWEEIGSWKIYPDYEYLIEGIEIKCQLNWLSPNELSVNTDSQKTLFQLIRSRKNLLVIENKKAIYTGIVTINSLEQVFITVDGLTFTVDRSCNLLTNKIQKTSAYTKIRHDGKVVAPMPGKIIEINIRKGQKVKKGDKLLVLEAMKMENLVAAPENGVVEQIHVKLNDRVEAGINLVHINLNETSSIKKAKRE